MSRMSGLPRTAARLIALAALLSAPWAAQAQRATDDRGITVAPVAKPEAPAPAGKVSGQASKRLAPQPQQQPAALNGPANAPASPAVGGTPLKSRRATPHRVDPEEAAPAIREP